MPNLHIQETRLVILDTEYTAWKGSLERNWSGPGEQREIVQVAAMGLDYHSLKEIWRLEFLTCPKLNSKLSEYFVKLTGIDQNTLAMKGIPFKKGINLLSRKIGRSKNIFSWGDGDEMALRETCKIQQVEYSSHLPAINDIRPVFEAAGINVKLYQSGTVYQAGNISLENRQHNSMHDVISMVETLRWLKGKGKTFNFAVDL